MRRRAKRRIAHCSADSTDQYDQPAIADIRADELISKKKNEEPNHCIYEKVLQDLNRRKAPNIRATTSKMI